MNTNNENTFSKEIALVQKEYDAKQLRKFTKAAMQALIAGYPNEHKVNQFYIANSEYKGLAEMAVEIARATLAALEKEKQP